MTTQPIKKRTRHHHRVDNVTSLTTALLKVSLLITACVSSATALACDDWLAKTVALSGAVERSTQKGGWQQLQKDQPLCPGDHIRVADNSRASLYLRNNTFMRLQENSVLHFPAPKDASGFWLEVTEGVAHFISRIVNRFEVNTPYVNAVVEGTEFTVSATTVKASVTVIEGQVKTWNDSGTAMLAAGQQVSATSRSGALTRLAVPASKSVEWAIYYPPVLTLDSLTASSADEQQQIAALLPHLQQNRPDLALKLLEQNGVTSPTQGIAHAALLLAVGDVTQFDARITPLLDGPQSAHAWSLKAIADAARNQPDAALMAAQRAVTQAPDLAAAHIAQSYAQQSALQLDDALTSAKQATEVEPKNSLAWLRVSEVHLMLGDIDAASTSLAQAESQPQALPAVQAQVSTARGFIHLLRLNLQAAHKSFTHAQTLDASDPQSHLGLGLAKLRDGDVENGRQQLEYAVSMDPMRSLLRSYLGRAYFEEKRDEDALTQWQLATQLDPNDPTPHFYTGVQKLFANDPIGATDDLETAKKLNNARAVYRGETLLESDAASRSATLARAYNETGYEQGVLLNGWEAIRRDPTSAEGHRLLADHYAKDSRFESARASALLQSQLWQPLTAYNLQPQLSETGISVVEGSGPQRPAFNEYHSLFMQEGAYAMANGFGGSDSTWGNDLGGSLLAGPFAVSLGQYHYESNGWRENADQEQDVYNGFMQWQVTPSTSVQAEARTFNWDKGDLGIALVGNNDESMRTEFERKTYRVGLKHLFDARNALIVSTIRQDVDERQRQSPQADTKISTTPEHVGDTIEAQYVWLGIQNHLIAGVGEYTNDQNVQLIVSEFDFPFFSQIDENNIRHHNAYAYYSKQLTQNFLLTAGASYNRGREERLNRSDTFGEIAETSQYINDDELSPKLGFAYQFTEGWTIRAAGFKTFIRELSSIQTLEPTQFVGFNQFFDDPARSIATNVGLALDASPSTTTRLSIEHLNRKVDFVVTEIGIDRERQIEDALSKLSLYHAINNRFSVSLQYYYSDSSVELLENVDGEVSALKTQRVPLNLHWYVSDRNWITLGTSYYDQRGDAQLVNPDTFEGFQKSFKNSAWPIDIELGQLLDCRCGDLRVGIKNIDDDNDEIATPNQELLAFYPSRFVYGTVRLFF